MIISLGSSDHIVVTFLDTKKSLTIFGDVDSGINPVGFPSWYNVWLLFSQGLLAKFGFPAQTSNKTFMLDVSLKCVLNFYQYSS